MVIAIIGILAAVTLSSLNTARKKAKITAIITEVRAIETALYMAHDDNPISGWWAEDSSTDADSNGIVTLREMVSVSPGIAKYIDLNKKTNLPPFDGPAAWGLYTSGDLLGDRYGYDNDGDDKDSVACGNIGRAFLGINLYFSTSQEYAEAVHGGLDSDGDFLCGKVYVRQDGPTEYILLLDLEY